MARRFLCVLMAALLLVMPFAALAEYDTSTITAPKFIVVDAADPDHVFYEREADTQAFPASTTKIMTCILALENFSNLDEEVTVGEEILGKFELSAGYSEKSSLMGLEIGETVTMRDLLYGLMLVSGNEAADAIAVAVSGDIKTFVKLMNSKAEELGMTSTHFVNPNGVNNANHYTTARDMAKLTAYALKNTEFRKIVGTASYTLSATNMHSEPRVKNNTNKLLYTQETDTEDVKYEYAIGVKTGNTPAAGLCLVAAAEKDGATVIIVMFGDESAAQYSRFSTAAAVFESVFDDMFVTLGASELNLQTEFEISIANAREEDLNENGKYVLTADTSSLAMRVTPAVAEEYKSNAGSIQAEFIPVDNLSAPLTAGSTVGTVRYSLNGEIIYSASLKTSTDIRETVLSESNGSAGNTAGGAVASSGKSLLGATVSTATSNTEGSGGSKALKILLIVVVALVLIFVLLIIALLILKEKKRREARRRRARRRAAQRRALEQQQYRTRSEE